MAILIDKNTGVIVQGITGEQGSFHTDLMKKYGTRVLAGVTPGKAGKKVHSVPVYGSVAEAVKRRKVEWSVLFVPAAFVLGAAEEALEAGLNLVIITEHVPVHDTLKIVQLAGAKGLRVIGPNCPGVITPGECKIGIMPEEVFKAGKVGVVSRSGTLTYEIVAGMTAAGVGQSTVVGMGGDPVVGMDFIDVLALFEADPEMEKIVLIGEIGGDNEERAAKFIESNVSKPVVAYIAGATAPEGKTMGHAGAVISGTSGTYAAKVEALEKAGVKVAKTPKEVVKSLG